MNTLNVKKVVCLILIFVSGCSNNSENVELVSLTGNMSKDDAEVIQGITGYDVLRKMQLGSWKCYAPDHDVDSEIFCTHKGKVKIFMRDTANKFAIQIPQSETSFTTITDNDKDGRFDSISYEPTSANGEVVVSVEDGNMDGQLDKHYDFKTSKLMLNIDGKWLEAKSKKENGKYNYYVNIDGKRKQVVWNEFPYKVIGAQ